MTTKETNIIKLNELKQKGNIFITNYVSPYFNYCRDTSFVIIKEKIIDYQEKNISFKNWKDTKTALSNDLKDFDFIKNKHIDDFIDLFKSFYSSDYIRWGTYWDRHYIDIDNIRKIIHFKLSDYLYFIKTDCDINILHRKIKIEKLSKL